MANYTPKIYKGVATRAGQLTSRIPLIIADLPDKTYEAIKELAEEIAEDAKERVVVGINDPHLQDAIHVETEEDYGELAKSITGTSQAIAVVAGDHDVFYGHMIENGSGGQNPQPPRPFLIPAFEAKKGRLGEIARDHLKDL